MTPSRHSLQWTALTDAVFLVGLAPSSLAPVSVAELHLYAYLANLVALNRGVPVSDWGYRFSVTADGFPFAHELKDATENLVRRSVLGVENGHVRRGEDLFEQEFGVLDGLVQSARRKPWLDDALTCVLHLPHGAVRDAINHSPGMVMGLRERRASVLLREADVDEIYREFELIEEVLGRDADDLLRPVVVWLSARIVSKGRP